MHARIEELLARRPVLAPCGEDIQRAVDALEKTYRAGGKLLLCGNGGSAADVDHISGELLKGFCSKRPLDAAARERLGDELAAKLIRSARSTPRGSTTAIRTTATRSSSGGSGTPATPCSASPLPATRRTSASPWRPPRRKG